MAIHKGRHIAQMGGDFVVSGDVGIWHETYRVHAGEYEAIYGDMPRIGLGAVGELVPIGSTSSTAAQRIGARPDDRSPVAY